MLATFKNCSPNDNMNIIVENNTYIVKPNDSAEIYYQNQSLVFEAQICAFDDFAGMIADLDAEIKEYSLKDKILAKLTKKFMQKVPEAVLDVNIKYKLNCNTNDNAVINLYSGSYLKCDGKIAESFDLLPIGYLFARAESDYGKIEVLDTVATNRKKFLKLMRNILLFVNWGLLFLNLFFFIPEYSVIKYYSSHFYIKKLFNGLYNKSVFDREAILAEKEQEPEKEEKKKGCLSSFLKVIVLVAILGGICYWVWTSELDVKISEDFSTVECFDETFVKYDGALPDNAKDVFLEEYPAYYPMGDDGEYDMDNFYCYIYETPDGTRYMWLKTDCTSGENADKTYKEYESPLIYKSIGEK